MATCANISYLRKASFSHVVGQKPNPVKTIFVFGDRRTISVVLLVLTHHLSVKALK